MLYLVLGDVGVSVIVILFAWLGCGWLWCALGFGYWWCGWFGLGRFLWFCVCCVIYFGFVLVWLFCRLQDLDYAGVVV